MTLGEVIKKYRDNTGMSMDAFAKQSGMSKAYINILEKNFNPISKKAPTPSLPKIKDVARVLGFELNDLLAILDDDQLISLGSTTDLPSNIEPMPKMHRVPRLGTIACGAPILAEENIECYDSVPDYVKADYTLVCHGDSMINARIFDGDIVCVQKQDTVNDGEIAVCLIGEDATLKRFRRYPDHIALMPENPMYQPLVYWGQEAEDIHIIGKATHFISIVK